MRARTLAISALLCGTLGSIAAQAGTSVPGTLTEQGRLTDSTGTPITVSTKLAFNIYNVSTGGSSLWNETHTVTPDNGYFSVQLGSGTSFPASLFDGTKLFLGVTVGSDPEMTPRQVISSVPYALVAQNAIGDITPNSVSATGGLSGGNLAVGTSAVGGNETIGGTSTVAGLLSANGGVNVGGTSVIDTSGNWVGPFPPAGTNTDYGGQTLPNSCGYYGCYGGSVTSSPASMSAAVNEQCMMVVTVTLPNNTTPGTGDYAYVYPALDGSPFGAYCYANYPAGAGSDQGGCTISTVFSASAGSSHTMGCFVYGTSGYAGDHVYCTVSYLCTPT